MLRRLVGATCVVVLVAACGGSGASKLKDLVVTPDEVAAAGGEQVTVTTGPGSTSLAGEEGRTLDQCAASFPSEAKRDGRYQVGFINAGTLISASNEVVRYKPGGAQQSFDELTAAVQNCKLQGASGELAVAPKDAQLADRQVVFSYKLVQNNGRTIFTANVYQYRGELLDAVYAFRPDRAEALRVALAIGARAKSKLLNARS